MAVLRLINLARALADVPVAFFLTEYNRQNASACLGHGYKIRWPFFLPASNQMRQNSTKEVDDAYHRDPR